MFRFKQLWVSFWRKDQGLGMIEAAITLPLFLVITFGVIEFGSMFLQRYQVRDVANDVADYLQANPSASSEDLQTFVTNLGLGTLKNTGPDQDNSVYTKIRIKSEKTMMTAAQFDTMCAGADKNWANPWVGGDAADDKNPYYIHVCYPYSYKTVTPLPKLMAGGMEETKILKGKALAYVGTPPAGGASPTVADMSCPSGQVLTGIVGGNPVCIAVPSGGGGGSSCSGSQVPGTVLSGGAIVADACSSLVTMPDTQSGWITWSPAKTYCENLTGYGYSDWRLPTMEELRVMYDNRNVLQFNPPADGDDPRYDQYWSSATYYGSSYGAWRAYFGTRLGGIWEPTVVAFSWDYSHQIARVRCVRTD